jgi:hypothetical protein
MTPDPRGQGGTQLLRRLHKPELSGKEGAHPRSLSHGWARLDQAMNDKRGNDSARDEDEAEFLVLVHVAGPVGCSQIVVMGTLSAFAVGMTGSGAGL